MELSSLSLQGILSLLRLSGYDCDVFYRYKDALARQYFSGQQTLLLQHDLLADLEVARDHILFLNPQRDASFALARIYMGLGDYETAYELFENSIQYVSNHHVAWHNMGICAYYLQDYERAIQCFMRVGAVWVGVTGRRWS